MSCGNLEGAQHVAAAGLGGAHGALAGGVAGAHQSEKNGRFAAAAGERAGKLRRLVVAPPPEPERMQRHGQDHVRFVQEGTAAAVQPATEAGHQIEPVAVLERQDGPSAGFVVAHYGAGFVIGGWT